MKKQELIDLINCSEESFDSLFDAECAIPRDVVKVASGIKQGTYRWFTTAVDVYKCEDGYVGVCGVQLLRSEGMSTSDCNCPCDAREYKEATTITYIPA
jgi:hypothetical protein